MATPIDSARADGSPPARFLKSVYVGHWHDLPPTGSALVDAIAFVESHEYKSVPSFDRYEIGVRYSNGDEIRGQFNDKAAALAFLRSLR